MKVKLVVAYDGTDFGGWQRQKLGRPTIQGSLEAGLSRIFNQPVAVCGAGRTDAGVHAQAQVAHFWVPKAFEGKRLLNSLNRLTPRGISVHSLWEVPNDFHARTSAQSKTYLYEIHNSPIPSVFKERFSLWLREEFDLSLLNDYSKALVGRQNFKSFQNQGSEVSHTVRVISEARWEKPTKDQLIFRITGNGFLRQMVRNIVGTLLELHRKKAPPSLLVDIIRSLDRKKAGSTVSPRGLCFESISYPPALDNQCRRL